MSRRFIAAAAALLVCSGFVFAQVPFPALSPAAVPGMRVLEDRTYDGNSLWGYIDGGADVYLEYGFKKVRAVKLSADSLRWRIDCYRMENPAAAFGIFSISRSSCATADSLPFPHCIARYQIQFALNDLYVSIADDRGDARSSRVGMTIARELVRGIAHPEAYELPALFDLPEFRSQKQNTRFIKGLLGIQNGFPAWENLFGTMSGYSLHVLPLETSHGDLTIAHVTFPAVDDMPSFLLNAGFSAVDTNRVQRHSSGGMLRCLWKIRPESLILLETGMSASDSSPFIDAIDRFAR